MMKARLTFDEAIASPEFDILAAQRLTMYRREVEEEMQLGLRKLHEGIVDDGRKKESGDIGSG